MEASQEVTMKRCSKCGEEKPLNSFYADRNPRNSSGRQPRCDRVCGLHVLCNLLLLPKSANQSKGNRIWPDMVEA